MPLGATSRPLVPDDEDKPDADRTIEDPYREISAWYDKVIATSGRQSLAIRRIRGGDA